MLDEKFWYLSAIKETCEAKEAGRLKNIFVEERDQLIVFVGKAQ